MAARALARPGIESLDRQFLEDAIAHRRPDLKPQQVTDLTARLLTVIAHWSPEADYDRSVLWPWPDPSKLPPDVFLP